MPLVEIEIIGEMTVPEPGLPSILAYELGLLFGSAPGGGLMPWREIFDAVRETPAEFVEFECYNTSIDDFGWSRGMFQNQCPDGAEFVRQGLEFVRPLV